MDIANPTEVQFGLEASFRPFDYLALPRNTKSGRSEEKLLKKPRDTLTSEDLEKICPPLENLQVMRLLNQFGFRIGPCSIDYVGTQLHPNADNSPLIELIEEKALLIREALDYVFSSENWSNEITDLIQDFSKSLFDGNWMAKTELTFYELYTVQEFNLVGIYKSCFIVGKIVEERTVVFHQYFLGYEATLPCIGTMHATENVIDALGFYSSHWSTYYSTRKPDEYSFAKATPLNFAFLSAQKGDIQELNSLMEQYNFHVDMKAISASCGTLAGFNEPKYTFLSEAIFNGHADMVEWLLGKGANPNVILPGFTKNIDEYIERQVFEKLQGKWKDNEGQEVQVRGTLYYRGEARVEMKLADDCFHFYDWKMPVDTKTFEWRNPERGEIRVWTPVTEVRKIDPKWKTIRMLLDQRREELHHQIHVSDEAAEWFTFGDSCPASPGKVA